MIISVNTNQGEYDIVLQRGALSQVHQYLNLDRKVMIITDSGVPAQYAKAVAGQCKQSRIVTFPQGEGSKNMDTYKIILEAMVDFEMTRTDCIVAVGGGVVGDMSGFAAATYMRGIDFYNIPTTLLSQVDSSIGGKTAIDFCGYKNIVGAFYPPKKVIIDPDTLSTLPARQISNGLAESVKMSLTCDKELFDMLSLGKENYLIDDVIARSLMIKKQVVEEDEFESGLRKVLNFGHTLGHAIEKYFDMDTYYHGECVALGMLPMCRSSVREQLVKVLQDLNLPCEYSADIDKIISACKHDKKMSGENITIVFVNEIGSFEMKMLPFCEFEKLVREVR